jgi:branched-chain amino acid transport system permease protein
MAVGGYTSAILMIRGWSPLPAVLAGIAGSLLIAAVFAGLVRRLSGMYLGAVTLAFGLFAESLATGLNITGGSSGLVGVPSFSVGNFYADNDRKFYYLVWGLVIVAGCIVAALNRSTFGRLLKSLHGDPVATSMTGFDVARGKLVALLVSATCASLAGSLYASYFHYLSPDMVGSVVSINLVTMVVVGGAGSVVGPVLGAVLITVLPTVSQDVVRWFSILECVLLILFLRFLPSGIWGIVVETVNRVIRPRRERPAPPPAEPERGVAFAGAEPATAGDLR